MVSFLELYCWQQMSAGALKKKKSFTLFQQISFGSWTNSIQDHSLVLSSK